MSSEDGVILIAASALIIDYCILVRRKKPFSRVQPSLKKGKKYSGSDLVKDLILNDVDKLNLEYRCNLSFKKCFRTTNTDVQTLLALTAPTISKKDTSFGPAIPAKVSVVEVPLLADSFSFLISLEK